MAPRDATMELRVSPEEGEYRSVVSLKFGDAVDFPSPPAGVRIETGDFARYERSAEGRRKKRA